jgi:hypothetical protein
MRVMREHGLPYPCTPCIISKIKCIKHCIDCVSVECRVCSDSSGNFEKATDGKTWLKFRISGSYIFY